MRCNLFKGDCSQSGLSRAILGRITGAVFCSTALGQSLRTDALWASSFLRKQDAVGVQGIGLHVGFHSNSGIRWNELMQLAVPGYRLQTTMLLERFEREGEFPSNRDFFFCELKDAQGSLVVPEGLFVTELSDQLFSDQGQLLVRTPLSSYVEQYNAPKSTTDRSVAIQTVEHRSALPIPAVNAVSAALMIHSVAQSNNDLPIASLSYLWIERINTDGEPGTIVLPTLLTPRKHGTYYDVFLNIPLRETDRLMLIDTPSLSARLQLRIASRQLSPPPASQGSVRDALQKPLQTRPPHPLCPVSLLPAKKIGIPR